MKNENFKYQLIAIQALNNKYGFCPAPEQVKLLESDGEGNYILFRVGEHEYHCEDRKITNIEEQKKFDEEIQSWLEISRMKEKDLDELRDEKERQEKQFATKEMMLVDAYNAKRAECGVLKGIADNYKALAEDRLKEIVRLEAKINEMKDVDDLFKKYRKNCDEQQSEINRLKNRIEALNKDVDCLVTARDEWKKRYEILMKDLTTEED